MMKRVFVSLALLEGALLLVLLALVGCDRENGAAALAEQTESVINLEKAE